MGLVRSLRNRRLATGPINLWARTARRMSTAQDCTFALSLSQDQRHTLKRSALIKSAMRNRSGIRIVSKNSRQVWRRAVGTCIKTMKTEKKDGIDDVN